MNFLFLNPFKRDTEEFFRFESEWTSWATFFANYETNWEKLFFKHIHLAVPLLCEAYLSWSMQSDFIQEAGLYLPERVGLERGY